MAWGAVGCALDHQRTDSATDAAADAGGRGADAALDAGPPTFEERCVIAWAREVAVDPAWIGLVSDFAVVEVGGEERVLAIYATSADLALGRFVGSSGEGPIEPTSLVRLAASEGHAFGAGSDPGGGDRVRFVEIDPRDGRELRSLGVAHIDQLSDLEAVALAETTVLRFTTGEVFGLVDSTPRPRGSAVLLTSRAGTLEVLSLGVNGGLVALPEGAALMTDTDQQLCADGVCRGSPGNHHVVRADGTVRSRTDRERAMATTPRASAALDGGDWIDLSFGTLTRWRADGTAADTTPVPFEFNVQELGGDAARTRVVTHTSISADAYVLRGGAMLPAGEGPRDVLVTWALPSLTPIAYATFRGAADGGRSGVVFARVGPSGRRYVSVIADPVAEVCGRRFEHSIAIVALE
jgi:hypothetical protein